MKLFQDEPRKHLNFVTTFIMSLVALFVLAVLGGAVYTMYLAAGFEWAFGTGFLIVAAIGVIFSSAWRNGMNSASQKPIRREYFDDDGEDGVG